MLICVWGWVRHVLGSIGALWVERGVAPGRPGPEPLSWSLHLLCYGQRGGGFPGCPPPLSFSFSSLGESLGITLCQQL